MRLISIIIIIINSNITAAVCKISDVTIIIEHDLYAFILQGKRNSYELNEHFWKSEIVLLTSLFTTQNEILHRNKYYWDSNITGKIKGFFS